MQASDSLNQQEQEIEKRWVFSWDLKADKVWACRTEKRRLFQMEGSMKEKARCPWNLLRLFRIRKMRVSAEERRVCDGVYSPRRSDRYSILCSSGNQCKSTRRGATCWRLEHETSSTVHHTVTVFDSLPSVLWLASTDRTQVITQTGKLPIIIRGFIRRWHVVFSHWTKK